MSMGMAAGGELFAEAVGPIGAKLPHEILIRDASSGIVLHHAEVTQRWRNGPLELKDSVPRFVMQTPAMHQPLAHTSCCSWKLSYIVHYCLLTALGSNGAEIVHTNRAQMP